jgi:hypothetical protein
MYASALDHRRFTRGTPKERAEYAADFVQSLKNHSFVKIINHGLDDPTIEELFTRVCLYSLFLILDIVIPFHYSSDVEKA